MAKKATVTFFQVRDCPFYVDGDCLNSKKIMSYCLPNELSDPPEDCPLEDAEV